MSEVIKVNEVTKSYNLYNKPIDRLKESMSFIRRKSYHVDFKALNSISFSVNKGECFGIIGTNGSGKSTILKIITGVLQPTTGSVEVNGRVSALLELGAGFDLELTGRENIYLNGAVLGYTKKFLNSKMNEIIEFSELGDFIEMPIRNYSSGMMARLAFSIASVVNPEILIVDEILSVGDATFQKKSRNRMEELMNGGATVLFVSHDIEQIEELCDKVIWLEHGTCKMFGDTKEICALYKKELGIE